MLTVGGSFACSRGINSGEMPTPLKSFSASRGRSVLSIPGDVEYTQLKCGPEEHDLCLVELPWTIERSSGSPLFFAATPPTRMATDGSEIYFAIGYPSKLTQLEVTDDGASEGIALSQVFGMGVAVDTAAW
jgi:hypothetical protein